MKETVIPVSNCKNCPLYKPFHKDGNKYSGCYYSNKRWAMMFNDENKNPECKVIEVVVKEED